MVAKLFAQAPKFNADIIFGIKESGLSENFMSLKLRFLIASVALVAASIILLGVFSIQFAGGKSETALAEAAKQKLVSQNVQTKEAVVEYLTYIESQIRVKSNSLFVADATNDFIPAYAKYAEQRPALEQSEFQQLASYYTKQFAGRYNELNPNPVSNLSSLYSTLPAVASALQFDFIANSTFPVGEKDKLERLPNESDYSTAHQKYHAEFKDFLYEFGYYDIFIVDVSTGNIVYSVFKELDYGTSLKSGPYANTGIGAAFKKASQSRNANDVFFTEFDSYLPSYDALAGFASSPIMVDGKVSAVLIFQMPMDHLNGILTHQREWKDRGFGDTGETYLVNSNGFHLTENRFFLEDPDAYIDMVRERFGKQANDIKLRATTVGVKPARSEASVEALSGKSGFTQVVDYRGVKLYSAYSPLQKGDINIAVMAEIEVDEALAAAATLKSGLILYILQIMFALLVISAFVTLMVVNRIVTPLNILGDTFEELTQGEADLTSRIKPSNIPEIARISNAFNMFIQQIQTIIAQIKQDAETIAHSAQQLSATTSQSENLTTQQKDQTGMVATAMVELSASIDEVAVSTKSASEKSIEVQESLEENMQRAKKAASNIKLLVTLINESSEVITNLQNDVNQISTVLNVITSIADQTNLLALNAAIEAARAGDAGRGFSVVADEVRALATRSQQNTIEISKLIEVMNQSSQKSVDKMSSASSAAGDGIVLIDSVTEAMRSLSESLMIVLDLSETVATATVEQNATSESVAENVQAINDMALEVSDGVIQISNSADNLLKVAIETQKLVSRFTV